MMKPIYFVVCFFLWSTISYSQDYTRQLKNGLYENLLENISIAENKGGTTASSENILASLRGLYLEGKYELCSKWGQYFIDYDSSGIYQQQLSRLISLSFLNLDDLNGAYSLVHNADPQLKLTDLQVLVYLEVNDISGAIRLLDESLATTSEKEQLRSYIDEYNASNIPVSKKIALLSAVPGLGYLKLGYTRTAISSVLTIGLFSAIAVESFFTGRIITGSFFSSMAITWYVGSIYGTKQTGNRDRHLTKISIFNKLKRKVEAKL